MDDDSGSGTGGNGNGDSGSSEPSFDFDGLWDFLIGIGDTFLEILENIVLLPVLIIDAIWEFGEWLISQIGDLLGDLVGSIGDLIKSIFVPDAEYIESTFNSFLNELKMKFGVDTGFFENLFQGEAPVEDVKFDYSIPGVGAFSLLALDATFFQDGVEFFRPFIRGFLVLLMILYHIRQVISFFGYDAGVVAGRSDHIASEKKSQREAM